jgi:uncharacterized membrane protein
MRANFGMMSVYKAVTLLIVVEACLFIASFLNEGGPGSDSRTISNVFSLAFMLGLLLMALLGLMVGLLLLAMLAAGVLTGYLTRRGQRSRGPA